MRIYNPQPDDPDYVNPIGSKYHSKTKTTLLTPSHTEYERLLKEYVRASNVIFCCTPSTTALFPASYLINPEGDHPLSAPSTPCLDMSSLTLTPGRKRGRLLACIGSHSSNMLELSPEILRYAVAPHHEHRHIHKRQKEGGAIIVDTVSGCLKHAGEIVQAKLLPDQVVELGELFMLKREAEAKKRAKGEAVGTGCSFQDNSGLKEWLTRGNVVYKSVGLGLMDVVVGNQLVELAREKGIGTFVENF